MEQGRTRNRVGAGRQEQRRGRIRAKAGQADMGRSRRKGVWQELEYSKSWSRAGVNKENGRSRTGAEEEQGRSWRH